MEQRTQVLFFSLSAKSILLTAMMLLSLSPKSFAHSDFSVGSTGRQEKYTGKEPLKASSELPSELENVGITEKLGQKLDLSLLVTDENNQKVPLSTFFSSHRPVIFSPVYFSCSNLCNFHLNGLVDVLKSVDWSPGKQFEVVAFSFDSGETAATAAEKKKSFLKMYDRPGTENGWHFVTADKATVQKITEAVGFKFKWIEKTSEWSHASAAIIVSDVGVISRYLPGIQFEPRDVKLALNEAANGKVGGIVDTVLLYCFKYDRHQSKYGLQVFRVMQFAGALTVAVLALWLVPVMIRAKRENG